jgi:hypothetical protein
MLGHIDHVGRVHDVNRELPGLVPRKFGGDDVSRTDQSNLDTKLTSGLHRSSDRLGWCVVPAHRVERDAHASSFLEKNTYSYLKYTRRVQPLSSGPDRGSVTGVTGV